MDLMLYRIAELAPLLGEPQTVQHHFRIEHPFQAVVGQLPREPVGRRPRDEPVVQASPPQAKFL